MNKSTQTPTLFASIKTFDIGKFAGLLCYYISPEEHQGSLHLAKFLERNEITTQTLIVLDLLTMGDDLAPVVPTLSILGQFPQVTTIVVHNTTKVNPILTQLKSYMIHFCSDVTWNGQQANEVHIQITKNELHHFAYYNQPAIYVEFAPGIDEELILKYLKLNYHLEFKPSKVYRAKLPGSFVQEKAIDLDTVVKDLEEKFIPGLGKNIAPPHNKSSRLSRLK